jgi:hypothetical protein
VDIQKSIEVVEKASPDGYQHLWEQIHSIKMGEEKISRAIKSLENMNLPTSDWYYKVDEIGVITGNSNNIKAIMEPGVTPQGTQINPV